jgi:hypothetical protein
MLDVHPPHGPTQTWKDFFLHIATITVGLLIAVGLEQTVEFFHHRHQMAEAREALRTEYEKNRKLFALETRVFEQRTPHLQQNLQILLYLRAHPHGPRASWPGTVVVAHVRSSVCLCGVGYGGARRSDRADAAGGG